MRSFIVVTLFSISLCFISCKNVPYEELQPVPEPETLQNGVIINAEVFVIDKRKSSISDRNHSKWDNERKVDPNEMLKD